MSKKDTALKHLLARGVGSSLAQKAISEGFSVTKIRTNKNEIRKLFSHNDAKELIDKCEQRRPISDEIVDKLLTDSDCKCCLCWDGKSENPIIFHHIQKYSETQDNSYDNLIVLCLHCHDKVHLPPVSGRVKMQDNGHLKMHAVNPFSS